MHFLQTYETTITSPDNRYSATVLVIPARSYSFDLTNENSLGHVAESLFGARVQSFQAPYIDPARVAANLWPEGENTPQTLEFASYIINAPVIPFESSPVRGDSISGITAAAKAGAVPLGALVGYIAGGSTPLLLITVPAGIILCGAAISFTKWMEGKRGTIWDKLLNSSLASKQLAKRRRKFHE